MYKVGICGHFALGEEIANGQIDKTRAVYNALADEYGRDSVKVIDTRGWQKNPVRFFSRCFGLVRECENIIMMPSKKGFKIFPAVFEAMNRLFGRKLFYIVIGGWLPSKLKAQPSLIAPLKKLDKVFVELEQMKAELDKLGLENVAYMPNFRQTNSIEVGELVCCEAEPLKVCTFSRIMEQKGIETAVEAVRQANRSLGRQAYVLDIYGNAEPDYAQRFEQLCEGFEPFINYRGYVGADSRTATLKNYFALLFPTVYDGEGFPGTVVDAFSAGVPVFATDWLYNSSIIRNGVEGLIYDPRKPEQLAGILIKSAENPGRINAMKPSCLERAAHFEADKAVRILIDELD